MPRLALAACLALATLTAAAQAETIDFHAALSGADEVPAKQTDGKGDLQAQLDTGSKVLSYTLTYSGLTGPATAAHLHGPASPGANAGVMVPFANAGSSPVKGTATLTDAQVADLEAGKVYANVHTQKNPGGEIRGQVERGK